MTLSCIVSEIFNVE